MTHEQIEEIAQSAAELYGREWATMPHYSKDIWRETVRHEPPVFLDPGAVQSEMELCVAKAKELHKQKRIKPEEVKPAEKKSKNKN